MKLSLSTVLGAALLIASGVVHANPELAKSKNCMACHGIENKIVGPAYKDVAKKYAGNKGAEAMLTTKVIKGGGGVWGTMAMPPNQVTEAEAKQLVKWILAMK